MIQYKKEAWVVYSVAVLMLILNVIIIKTAYTDNAVFYWLLIVTIPLLIIVIYISWQKERLRHQYYIDNTKAVLPGTHFGHSSYDIYPKDINEIDLGVLIGNEQCRQPYKGSVLNIRLMSNWLSKNSVDEKTGTYQLTGKGLVLQIGADYFACRTENGNFDSKTFQLICSNPEVKMIELVLPSSNKFKQPNDSIFQIAETPKESNSIFHEAEGMIHFLDSLRILSGGKSTGIRLSIDNKKSFYKICYAMQKTQFFPDFIVVEGALKGKNDVMVEQKRYTGLPLFEALQFVSGTFQHYSLEKKIKIVAAGNITSGSDILKILATGANVIYCEIPDYNISKSFPKEFLLNRNQIRDDIYNNLRQITVDAMKVYGFKYVNEITIPNLFNSLNVIDLKRNLPLNDSILYGGAVKKIYNTKIKTHHIPGERNKQGIA